MEAEAQGGIQPAVDAGLADYPQLALVVVHHVPVQVVEGQVDLQIKVSYQPQW